MDELLGISDFSARCGLSVKMLRTYAARGVVVPAAVDASSGYRYYAAGQLHDARVVALLRQAGVPVRDIAAFIGRPEQEQLDRWARQLDREWAGRRRALDEARAALGMVPGAAPAVDERSQERRGQQRKGGGMTCMLAAGAATHVGGRASNEDALVVSEHLYAVADGLGGLEMGDVASRLALDTLAAAVGNGSGTAELLAAGLEANDTVWRHGGKHAVAIGTTLTAFVPTEDGAAMVIHVGDSRLYRLRGNRLEQLTEDHTVTADLVRTGALRAEDVSSHPHRHVLTRALGVAPAVELDQVHVRLEAGDRFLLCTDGLYAAGLYADGDGLLQPEGPAALRDALAASAEPQACADGLVAIAVGAGTTDNATAVVIDVR